MPSAQPNEETGMVELPRPTISNYAEADAYYGTKRIGKDTLAARAMAICLTRELAQAREQLRAAQKSRDAVLEEAAIVCDDRAKRHRAGPTRREDTQWAEAVMCTEAIRALIGAA